MSIADTKTPARATTQASGTPKFDDLTPRQIVHELDRHIIGQHEAKKMVAIALRNRMRRRRLPEDLQDEVSPKNIIMIGSTGVGKTEIARRLAKLAGAPFVKVEATKYTEIGYVGRDVESMIRDLVETAIKIVREEKVAHIRVQAERRARNQLIDLLVAGGPAARSTMGFTDKAASDYEPGREDVARRFDRGELDDEIVEVKVQASSPIDGLYGVLGMDESMMGGMKDMMERMMPPQRSKSSKMTAKEAMAVLVDQEIEDLLDMDKITREALERAEQTGIVFIDEIDKIAGRDSGHGPDVSRQGVQRDILPIIEGCTVGTKHGFIRTDHVLFIAAGAFHTAKPSDLIPELQGRFPLRVELHSLKADDFKRILTEPDHSLIEQYKALLRTDGVILDVTEDAIDELANSAMKINEQTEDIGARRLHTILERVLQDVAFDAPDVARGEFVIDREYVLERLQDLMKDTDLSRFIL